MADVASLIDAFVDTRISDMKIFTRSVRGKSRITLLVFLCFEALFTHNAFAEVRLPSIFTDHMVLQRNLPVIVRGSADAGETVAVTFRGETRGAVSDKFGRWQITLQPGTAGGPFVMEIHGKNSIRLSDVLVGDVWVASGQSNMEFPMSVVANATEELKAADLPNIRLLHVNLGTSPFPLEDVSTGGWDVCSPKTAVNFSAVAFFFAKEVQQDQNVPIGIIGATIGGTAAEAWTSMRALSADASLMPAFANWAHFMENESRSIPEKQFENQTKSEAKAQGKPEPQFPYHPDYLTLGNPSVLYNAMIAPLTRFPIRGVIWYQGESNTPPEQAPVYANLFQTLIRDWRHNWAQGDFPFLFVQLPNFNTNSSDDGWMIVREAQREALTLNKTAMAVAIDIGDPATIHPNDKQDVGHRLALAARAIAYSEPIEYSGPLFRMQSREGNAIRIWFDHSTGLVAKNGKLAGFEIAGADKKFVPGDAQIEGDSVIVSSKEIAEPVVVRYAWKDNPYGNLYNAADLPASPFKPQQ